MEFPWLATRSDGLPFTWPCGPIRYRLILNDAPAGAQELVADTLDGISVVSGYDFQQDASLDRSVPEHNDYPGIEIACIRRDDFPDAHGDPSVIGSGGAVGTGDHYTHGFVRILRDRSGYGATDFTAAGGDAVLLHELGHALGLKHTDDRSAVMYPTYQGTASWSPAEQAALRYLHQTCA